MQYANDILNMLQVATSFMFHLVNIIWMHFKHQVASRTG